MQTVIRLALQGRSKGDAGGARGKRLQHFVLLAREIVEGVYENMRVGKQLLVLHQACGGAAELVAIPIRGGERVLERCHDAADVQKLGAQRLCLGEFVRHFLEVLCFDAMCVIARCRLQHHIAKARFMRVALVADQRIGALAQRVPHHQRAHGRACTLEAVTAQRAVDAVGKTGEVDHLKGELVRCGQLAQHTALDGNRFLLGDEQKHLGTALQRAQYVTCQRGSRFVTACTKIKADHVGSPFSSMARLRKSVALPRQL